MSENQSMADGGPVPDCCAHLSAGAYGCTDCLNTGHAHGALTPCQREPQTTPQDAREGGRNSLEGVPGGERTSEGADGASGGSLGDRLRAAADYQDRPGAYDELRAMADEADQMAADLNEARAYAEDESATRRGLANRLTEAENLLRQARGDLAAQEGIAQELRGQINGLIQEKDQWHDSAKVAEATVGRALVLAAEWASSPAVGGSSSEQWEFDTLRTAARDLYEALDGGTEADRG